MMMVQDESDKDINMHPSCTPIEDSISAIKWIDNPSLNVFAATSWDGFVKIYQVQPSNIIQKGQIKVDESILCASWRNDGKALFVGCADGSTRMVDMDSGSVQNVGKQNLPVSTLHWVSQYNAVMSASFDRTLNFYTLGASSPAASINTGHKITRSDLKYPLMLCGALQKVSLVDLNMLKSTMKINFIDSFFGAKSQIECVALNNEKNFALMGSMQARGNILSIQMNKGSFQLKSQTIFKCQKRSKDNINYMYPINTIGFSNKAKNYMFLGGSECSLETFNYVSKNPLKKFQFQQPVITGESSPSGELIAYGLGNDWHMGVQTGKQSFKNKICVHVIQQK